MCQETVSHKSVHEIVSLQFGASFSTKASLEVKSAIRKDRCQPAVSWWCWPIGSVFSVVGLLILIRSHHSQRIMPFPHVLDVGWLVDSDSVTAIRIYTDDGVSKCYYQKSLSLWQFSDDGPHSEPRP